MTEQDQPSGDATSQESETQKLDVNRLQTLEPPQLLPKRIPTPVIAVVIAASVGIVFLAGGSWYNVLLILAVIVGLSAIVMMHEGAHFLVGKLSGMKITEFFVGFGPRIWSTQKGETEYGVKSIPAGGYVRIIGMTSIEEVAPEDEDRAYRSKSYPRRVATTGAGIASHFLLAWILAFVFIMAYGTADKPTFEIAALTAIRGGDSPAQKAGLKVGDVVISYDGHQPKDWEKFREYIDSRPNQKITFIVRRNGELKTLYVTPINGLEANKRVQRIPGDSANPYTGGFIGVSPGFSYRKVGALTAAHQAGAWVANASKQIVSSVASVFAPSGLQQMYKQITNDPSANNYYRFSSPVGITRVAGDAARQGMKQVLSLIIVINLSLGIVNLLPLLPLDGGHIAIATYERIRSRKGKHYMVDIRKVAPVAYGVAAVLILMSLASLYLDIARPLSLQ